MTTALVETKRSSLSEPAQARLAELEATVRRGLAAYVEAARALAEIRDNRLYREKYDTFEEYVAGEFGWNRDRAYKLIAAGKVHADVSHGIHDGPENERQARTLTKLKDVAERREAWARAREKAAGGRITGKIVNAAVQEIQAEDNIVTVVTEKVEPKETVVDVIVTKGKPDPEPEPADVSLFSRTRTHILVEKVDPIIDKVAVCADFLGELATRLDGDPQQLDWAQRLRPLNEKIGDFITRCATNEPAETDVVRLLRDARKKVLAAKKQAGGQALAQCADLCKRIQWAIDCTKAGM